jgi:hypothetical protein
MRGASCVKISLHIGWPWNHLPRAAVGVRPKRARRRVFAISRRFASEVCCRLPALLVGGHREDRVLAAPAVSRAICANKAAHEHTGTGGASRPSLRNGFTACFVLSPENGSFASVATEEAFALPDLTPAPRRPNHTTSPYASRALACRTLGVHRIPPHVRDDRERPSMGETSGVMPLICVRTKAEYFCAKGWTDFE